MDGTLDRQTQDERAEDLSLALPARPEQVGHVRREVEVLARAAGLGELARRDVALAVSEACANVVVHAYATCGLPEDERVLLVMASVRGGLLQIEVTDRGAGMVPRHDSPGMGLGLPLIASLTDELEVREAQPGGTTMRMAFRVRAEQASADVALRERRRIAG